MADTATLTSKFQISVPKAVRERQRWEAGQKLVFIAKGKGVLLVPAPALDDLRGIARGADPEGYRDRGDQWSVPTWHSPLSCRGSLGGVASER